MRKPFLNVTFYVLLWAVKSSSGECSHRDLWEADNVQLSASPALFHVLWRQLRYFMAASSALKRDIGKLRMGLQVISVLVENRRIGGRGRRGRNWILLHA